MASGVAGSSADRDLRDLDEGDEAVETGALSAATPSAATPTAATPSGATSSVATTTAAAIVAPAERPADRCLARPTCGATWPPPQARALDFPSPRNSDGTLKTLPTAPPSERSHTLLLCYDDFGPQAMAFAFLGMAWWSWEGGGSFEPGDSFDVRVVVYSGRTEDEVKARYPTVEGASDYRLVSRAAALRYLADEITDLRASESDPDGGPIFHDLRIELQATERTIRACLPF